MKPLLFFPLFLCFSIPALSQGFYAHDKIVEIRLELPYKNWDFKLDSLKRNNPDARLEGGCRINGQYFANVGVRYKGNSSYFRTRKDTFKKLPFNIKINFKDKTCKLSEGFTTIRLSNAFLDPSFIRDPLMYEAVRRYMPVPRCNFANLYVNDRYYGLYINTEGVDTNFIRRHFGTTTGHIIKCDPDNWKKIRAHAGCPRGENASLMYLNDSPGCYEAFYEVDDAAAWKPLLQLIKILNKNPEKIESVLNVDQTLWMHALNNVMVNLDSYTGALSHNYYLWVDTLGICHPIMWDFNMAFGSWRRDMNFENMTDEQLIMLSPLAEHENKKRPLISNILRNPLYQKVYLAHYKTIVRDLLESNELIRYANQLTQSISPWVKLDSLKLYSTTDFENAMDKTMTSGTDKIIGIRQLMEARGKWLSGHTLLNKPEPKFIEKQHHSTELSHVFSLKVENAKAVFLCYRKPGQYAFNRISMKDNREGGDATAGNRIYTIQLNDTAIKDYYFIVEGQDSAITVPARASREFFSVQ